MNILEKLKDAEKRSAFNDFNVVYCRGEFFNCAKIIGIIGADRIFLKLFERKIGGGVMSVIHKKVKNYTVVVPDIMCFIQIFKLMLAWCGIFG